ncbi:MAG: transcriptional repressor LexA [Myxococcota bacterium]
MPRAPRGESRERVYVFLRDRLLEGEPPTVREVQEAMGFSAVQTAREHLEALVEDGRLEKTSGRSRAYRLAPSEGPQRSWVSVPLLGQVQAGALTTAVEEAEGFIGVETRLPAEQLFALRVRGESMIGAGILDGDVVVVRRQSSASSGDIVVALVGEEATVKRLRLTHDLIELLPENPAFVPLSFGGDEASLILLGKVIEVRRVFEH